MKNLFMALIACLSFSTFGCAEDLDYGRQQQFVYSVSDQPYSLADLTTVSGQQFVQPAYQTGSIEYCDMWGCRIIPYANYYYAQDGVVYWDPFFGCWIGHNRYFRHGYWYHGYVPGYHTHYTNGTYRSLRGVRGGSHGGAHVGHSNFNRGFGGHSGARSGSFGGRGGHGGGHGGGHR